MSSDPRLADIEAQLEDVVSNNGRPSDKKESIGTILVGLASERAELFHGSDGKTYATIMVADHVETCLIRSGHFRRWLAQLAYDTLGKAPGGQALADATAVLDGRAAFAGDELPVSVRLGGDDAAVHLDLGDASWGAVEITAAGWKIVRDPAVRMRRPSGFAPLPVPVRGGSLDELRRFVNVATDTDFRLLVGFLVGALRARGPYPVLILHGEQGSAKSTTARIVRGVLDPSIAPVRSAPRNEHELAISAENQRVLAFDNLSHLPGWYSDALCRLATGGGFAVRTLYENQEETIFRAQRPVILNGIEDIATRADLLDRALVLYLPTIRRVRSEKALLREFELAHPRILGALLDAASCAMRNISTTSLDVLPRMADFAEWVVAAEPTLPWSRGEFMRAYTDNRASAHELTLEASPIGGPIRELAAAGGFEGKAKELLARLEEITEEKTTKGREWPKSPRGLTGALRRIAPTLRATGIEVEIADHRASRHPIRIRAQETVATVDTVSAEPKPDLPSSPETDRKGPETDRKGDRSEGSDSAPGDRSYRSDRSSRPRSYEGNGFEPATEEQLDLADRIANRWGPA